MRINTAGRTPIWLAPRPNGGVTITQGSSHILLDEREIRLVFAAITELQREYRPSTATTPSKARLQRFVGGIEQPVFDLNPV